MKQHKCRQICNERKGRGDLILGKELFFSLCEKYNVELSKTAKTPMIRDVEGVHVYSLADFTAQQGVRDTTDVVEKYRRGVLGALPDPELINSLLSIKGNIEGDEANAK